MRTVLFLCVFNATRSIMAEALLNHLGSGRFRAFSAGERPAGEVHPMTLTCLTAHGIPAQGLRSKPWEHYIGLDAPRIDAIVSVRSDSRENMNRHWREEPLPIKAHWNTAPPGASGTPEEVRAVFERTYDLLRRRVEALVQLPLDSLDRTAQWHAIMRIGEIR